MHEVIHAYTANIARAILKTDKIFEKEVENLYKIARLTVAKDLSKYVRNQVSGKESEYHDDLITAIFRYVKEFHGLDTATAAGVDLNLMIQKVKENTGYSPDFDEFIEKYIYGLKNQDELLSEGLSSVHFAAVLNNIKTGEQQFNNREYKSVLYKLLQEFRAALQRAYDYAQESLYARKQFKTALDDLEFLISNFDELFSNSEDLDFTPDPYEDNVDLKIDLKLPNQSKKLNTKIIRNLLSTLSRRKDIQTLKDVREYITRVNKHLKPEKQLGDSYAHAVLKGIIRDRVETADAKIIQKNSLAYAKKQKAYENNFKYRKDVDNFAAVDVEALNRDQRHGYVSGFSKLVTGGIPTQKETNIMINFGKVAPAKQELLPVADKLHKTYIGYKNDKWDISKAMNAGLFTSVISKFDTVVGDKIFKNIYSDLMGGFTKSIKESTDLSKKVNEIADKHRLNQTEISEVGMYGRIFATKSDPNNKVEWLNEIKENAKFVTESADNKLQAWENDNYNGKLTKKEIEAELEAAKAIEAKVNKAVKMEGILSKGQQQVYDTIREFTSKYENDFERNAVGVWGDEGYEHLFNYFPSIAGGKAVGEFQSEDDLITERANDLFDAVNKNEAGPDKTTVAGKASKSKESRKNAKGYYYDFDATNIASKHSKNMLLDLYTSTEFKKLNRLLKDSKFRQAMSPTLIKSLTKQIQHIAGAGGRQEVSKGWNGIAKMREALYTSAIATTGQFFLQAVSGVANATILTLATAKNPKQGAKNLSKALSAAGQVVYAGARDKKTNEFYNFMVENGLGIQIRDVFFERYFKPSEHKSLLAGKAGKIGQIFQNTTEAPTRWGDKYAAAAVFFSAYFNAGGTIENPDKDAIIRAEREVAVLQGMSDVNFSASIFRPKDKGWRTVMTMLYAFKSFALNSELALLYSLKNAPSSPEARKIAAAQVSSVLAYRLLQGYVVSTMYKAAAQYLADAGDDEEDEKRFSWMKDIFWNSMWDMLLGGYAPAFVDGIFRYWFNKNQGFGAFTPENGEEFNKYLDSPLYSAKDASALYKGLLGPGYSDIAEAVIDGIDLDHSTFEEDGDWEKESKRQDKAELWALGLIGTAIGASTKVPFRGDAKRIMEKTINERKGKAFRQKGLGGGGSGEIGEEQFVFPDGPIEPTEPNLEEQ